MRRSEFRGTGKVFAFTLVQTLKNRGYLIFTLLIAVLSLVSMPLLQFIQNLGGEDEKLTESNIREIVWYDETEELFGTSFSQMGLSFDKLHDEPAFAQVTLADGSVPYEEMLETLENEEPSSHTVIARLYMGELGLTMEVVRPASGEIGEEEGSFLADCLTECVVSFKEEAANLTDAQRAVLDTQVSLLVQHADENNKLIEEEDTTISNAQYWLIYALAFVVMMVNCIASSQVASSIVVDKSTRVVEVLLTSVRPMALVMGKTLAMLLASVGQMFVMIALLLGSNWATGLMSGEKSVLEGLLPAGIWSNINPFNLLLSAVVICFGFLFYAVLAAMCGATVSKIEETQEGLMLLTISNMIGVYIAVMAANLLQLSGNSAFVTFSLLFPLSSPYLLPGALLIGNMGGLTAFLAVAVLVAVDLLLLRFVATIYELLITHNGSPIKLKELFGIYKSLKKERKTL